MSRLMDAAVEFVKDWDRVAASQRRLHREAEDTVHRVITDEGEQRSLVRAGLAAIEPRVSRWVHERMARVFPNGGRLPR